LTLLVGRAEATSLVAEVKILVAEETREERVSVELEERESVAEVEEEDSVDEVSEAEEVREFSEVVLEADEVATMAVVADSVALAEEVGEGTLQRVKERVSAERLRGWSD